MNNDNFYYLMGTNMIAYIKLKGIDEIKIELTKNKRVKYWFQNTDELHRLIEEFKTNELLQNFVNQQNIIKETIFKLRNKKVVV